MKPNIRQIEDVVFYDYGDDFKSHIFVAINGSERTVSACVKYAGLVASAVTKCNPEDTWDETTGVTLCLTRLKIKFNAARIKRRKHLATVFKTNKSKKVWIPKKGEPYWCYIFDNGVYYADEFIWGDDDVDFCSLAEGNVFRTQREALKAGRGRIFEGRKIAKEVRRGK